MTALLAPAVCVLCLTAIASHDALSRQTNSPVAHTTTPRSLTVDKMRTDDDLFENVPFDTNEQTACSPAEPSVDWRGVQVRAPSQVILPGKGPPHSALIIPLCGIYRISLAKAIRHPGPRTLIVTDADTGQSYRGPIVDRDPNITIPPPRLPRRDPAAFEGIFSGNYFNVNVASYVALPLQPARYRVKVEWSGYESNEVSIAVVQRR
jgi:hypothetical protein